MIKILFAFCLLILNSCDELDSLMGNEDNGVMESESWVFTANEGNYGSSNGSISMIGDAGQVFITDFLGQTVQALEVYNDKLIVLINGDSKLKIFDITTQGLSMPGIEVDLEGSSPRDLVVVNDKIYFTNWNSQDIKIFNLFNYVLESPISVPGLPEGIIEKDGTLWVAITMNSDWSPGQSVLQYDIQTGSLLRTVDVGSGPVSLEVINEDIYVSRTYYDAEFNPNHGMSKFSEIHSPVLIQQYGSGVPCGGSVLSINNQIYRTLSNEENEGGIVALNEDLTFNASTKIGSYPQSYIYHVEVIDDQIWFALTNYSDYNSVKVISFSGDELASYDVGIAPGDFAKWQNND